VIGLALAPVDAAARQKYGLEADVRGALIEGVDQGSDAAQKGLRRGDVIVRAGDREVGSASDFASVVDSAKKAGRQSVLVGVHRNGRTSFVSLKFAAG
jgi:serine protease Do